MKRICTALAAAAIALLLLCLAGPFGAAQPESAAPIVARAD